MIYSNKIGCKHWFIAVVLFVFLAACSNQETLPFYGKYAVKTPSGFDTIVKTIPPFEMYNQDSVLIDNESLYGSIYVADFFFTSCPSICPVMHRNMITVSEKFGLNSGIKFISYTIDPERDNVSKLKLYANKLGVQDSDQWSMLTGSKDDLYGMAEAYMIPAYPDNEVPGGFEHSGQFVLVDKLGRIRGYYDGTKEDDVVDLIADIEILLNEK